MAGRPPIPLEKRFWEKVDRLGPDDCWLWRGARHGKDYGGILIDYKSVPAHRVSYALCKGVVPPGMFVLHRCDMPKCVNPAHLFLGTHQDNMDDMARKGRSLASLKPDEAIAARALHAHFGWSPSRIARRFDVDAAVIGQLLARKTYKHVGPDLTEEDVADV